MLPDLPCRVITNAYAVMDHLIRWSKHPDSGFYLDQLGELSAILEKRNNDGQSTLLVGVSFALLDLAEKHNMPLWKNIRVMETGVANESACHQIRCPVWSLVGSKRRRQALTKVLRINKLPLSGLILVGVFPLAG